jgi:ABC-type transport system involved in cytochrome c biogenesis permease subunit
MNWTNFPFFAITAAIFWILGIILVNLSEKQKVFEKLGKISIITGLIVLISFLTILWINLERPPLRTLGETRLWYSVFLPLVGIITYLRWGYKWFISYALLLAMLFLFINYLHPETYEKTLMPALQSIWFVPHVIVYIFSYALLAASSLVALKGLYEYYFKKFEMKTILLADNLVYIGFSFLTLGLLFGALWAKEAWGHYWTWDPKETWAFLTWLIYLVYMHFRTFQPKKIKEPLWMLSLAFVVLMICWFGINYLPSAQNSVHVYSR